MKPRSGQRWLGATCLLVLCGTSWPAAGGDRSTAIFSEPLSPRIANYRIDVRLDDESRRLTGDLHLTWTNPSDDTIDHLEFHLYWNAFKNARSSFGREVLHAKAARGVTGAALDLPWEEDDGWGWIHVDRMTVDGRDVTDRIAFHRPDDGNVDDETVIRVGLPDPVEPRGTAKIDIAFTARIPKCHVRAGWWHDDFFMIAQWFPKIGVYEPPGMRNVPESAETGQWNCHQFHAATEFYADYGVYDVTITLPARYVVGATGNIVEQRLNPDGTQTVVAHAEDVHDFAWAADPSFRETGTTWRDADTGREVGIRLLYQPGHASLVDEYLDAAIASLDHVHRWLGPGAYPYPNLTIVDPRRGSGAGGMEYPTLITGGGDWTFEQFLGDGFRPTELVTVHEFVHQIWYGIVGNNEFEEAWLDEGFTTYSEGRITGELFGADTSVLDWWGARAGSVALQRLDYAFDPTRQDAAIADPTFAHWSRAGTRGLAYGKTSLALKTLENHLGRERFDRIMREYYGRWRFRHPAGDDFLSVVGEEGGEEARWLFEQLVRSEAVLDYGVAAIDNVPVEALSAGLSGHPPGDEPGTQDADASSGDLAASAPDDEAEASAEAAEMYDSRVVFRRIGEVVFPMETVVEFADGHVERGTWNGRSRIKTVRFQRSAQVVRAAIDPDHRVPLDVDRYNNSLRVNGDDFVTDKYTVKGFFWMQSLLQLLGSAG